MPSKTHHIDIDTKLCQACWECIDACPNEVLGKVNLFFHKHVKVTQADNCNGCGTCASICPAQAISMVEG